MSDARAAIGMLVIGIVGTLLGTIWSILTLFKGEVVVVSRASRTIIREKIKEIKPLRFRYFFALVFTLLFGPVLFLIGIAGLATFISTQLFK